MLNFKNTYLNKIMNAKNKQTKCCEIEEAEEAEEKGALERTYADVCRGGKSVLLYLL